MARTLAASAATLCIFPSSTFAGNGVYVATSEGVMIAAVIGAVVGLTVGFVAGAMVRPRSGKPGDQDDIPWGMF